MSSVAASRPLQRRWQVQVTTRLKNRLRVLPPVCLIQVNCQEKASLVSQHWVNAHDEIAPRAVLSGEMPADHFVGNRQEMLMCAGTALDPRFFANARHPFVGTSGRVT